MSMWEVPSDDQIDYADMFIKKLKRDNAKPIITKTIKLFNFFDLTINELKSDKSIVLIFKDDSINSINISCINFDEAVIVDEDDIEYFFADIKGFLKIEN